MSFPELLTASSSPSLFHLIAGGGGGGEFLILSMKYIIYQHRISAEKSEN